MIHFHCYQQEPVAYDVGFDPATGALKVSGALMAEIELTTADIRTRYGDGDLLVYVWSDPSGSVSIGVFPGEKNTVSEARKAFLKEMWTTRCLLLMADLPVGTGTWLDPGMRVVSIYSYTDPKASGHTIEVSSNEPDAKLDAFSRYLQDNPLRIAWALEKGTVINAKAV
ncbi:hypothetical protein J7643_03785 [bacterium]|nr:hypothetical protein [bacterium]